MASHVNIRSAVLQNHNLELTARKMFNYTNIHRRTNYHLVSKLGLALLLFAQSAHTDVLDFNSDDTITIIADKAREGDQADVIHFSGNFELRAPDWYMSADSATVYGKLDNPDKVILEGRPAKIYFLRDNGEDADTSESTSTELDRENIEGSALKIEYLRTINKLKMTGSATLKRKDNQLSSEVIEYDIDADRYSASGDGGINIQVNPSDD